MRKFDKALEKVEKFFAELAGWIVILMMLTVSYDVIARYCFGAPTKWSLEVNEYFLLAVVYLPGAWALRVGGHVRVDVFYSKLSGRARYKMDIFTSLLGFIFTLILVIESAKFVYDGYITKARSETYLEVLQWPIRTIMLVGAILVMLEFLLIIYRNYRLLKENA